MNLNEIFEGSLEMDTTGRQQPESEDKSQPRRCSFLPNEAQKGSKADVSRDFTKDLEHPGKLQLRSEVADTELLSAPEQGRTCETPHSHDGFCDAECYQATLPKHFPVSCALPEAGGHMQREGQQRLRRKECLHSHITKDALQSRRARQEQKKEVLEAASYGRAQGKAECPSPTRLKQALTAVAAARTKLPSPRLQRGVWKLPQGLAERQRDMRLAAKCLQDYRRSKSLQLSQPPLCSRVTYRRTSKSSVSST